MSLLTPILCFAISCRSWLLGSTLFSTRISSMLSSFTLTKPSQLICRVIHFVYNMVLYYFLSHFQSLQHFFTEPSQTLFQQLVICLMLSQLCQCSQEVIDWLPGVDHGDFLVGTESLARLAMKFPHEVLIESFYYALIKGLDERQKIWWYEKNFYVGMSTFDSLMAMSWGTI